MIELALSRPFPRFFARCSLGFMPALAMLANTAFVACGADQTHPPLASDDPSNSDDTTSLDGATTSIASGGASATSTGSVASNTPANVNSQTSSGDFIPPPIDSRTGNGPDSDEACQLAILGNPGFNPGANFAQWLAERGPVVDRFVAGPDLQTFTFANLQTYDVVLLDRLAPDAVLGISATELATWVEAGGRVIALSGYGDYPEVVQVQNALLTPLGLGFVSETPVWGPVTQFTQHPINAGLQSLTFVGGREVSHQAGDEVIMTLETDIAVGVIAVRGSGRLFLFGDEWVTFDSEWVALPEIEQFWVNIFDWLGGCELLPLGQAR